MNSHIKKYLLQSTMLVGALTAGLTTSAYAQDEGEDEIVVTGSRIVKKDFTSNSPIATIGDEEFEFTGTVNTESLLNTLPQAIPGFDRTSNNPGNGTATVDLRGLGANRTLVLVDGKRMVPTTGGGVVDINNIPTSLIESVEVVTGGASAVYGSDAVSGVVNFILKDDFEGIEASVGYEATERGDAEQFSANVTMGANFDNGRGNAVIDIAYTDRNALFQGDRDFSTFAQFDDIPRGSSVSEGLFDGGSSGIPSLSIFGGGPVLNSGEACAGVTFTPEGDVRCFVLGGDNNDFYNYAPVNYIQLPQKRFQGTGLASYEINDSLEAYGKFMFAQNDVPQQLAPTPIFQVSEFSIDGSPFLTPQSQSVLSAAYGNGVDTDGDGIDDTGTAFLRRRLLEVGPRISDDQFTSFQLQGGLRGDISENWNFDVSLQEGRVLNSSAQRGNVSRSRFDEALLLADDGTGTGNLSATECSSGDAACAPINIFGEGNISDGGAAYLRTSVNSDARYRQTMLTGSITGNTEGWLELPGGEIGLAFGAEYRDEEFDFDPSQDLATGNIAGFNGAPAVPTSGFDVWEVYGEAYLPILGDVEFIDVLALELAYRYSDYSTRSGADASLNNSFSADAWKIAGEWGISENLRFRASYNTAVRAPSITEFFSPAGEGFPGATDPCAEEGNPDAATIDVCQNFFADAGIDPNIVGTSAINLPAGQVRALFQGTPTLQPEEAKTFTVGFVADPMSGVTVAVDYFDIEIEEAIATFGGGAAQVLQTCYTNPTLGGIGSEACNAITRRSTGDIRSVLTPFDNVAFTTLEGIDGQISYSGLEAFGGAFNFNYLGTYTMSSTFQASVDSPVDDCAGEFGVLLCGEPVPEYKHRMTGRWTNGTVNASLSWRHISGVEDDDPGTTYFVDSLDSANYFDASASYDLTENFTFLVGVDNLLDKTPPIIGDNQEQANTYPATYDVFGRTFFGKLTAKF